jgi:SPP1 gp7 family putative phage head morphogenesis protein
VAKQPVRPEDILSATQTVNEEVLDRAIRHAHYLERLKSHEVNQIVGFLNDDVLPDALTTLRRRLENIKMRGFDTGPWTSKRIKQTIAGTNEIMQKGMQTAGGTLRTDLKGIARTEAEWQVKAMQGATGALDIALELPGVGQLNSILTSRPYEGHVFKEWWGKVSRSSQEIIQQQVSIGLAEGETVDEMIRRLKGTVGARFRDGALEKVRHNVAATVRTATNHVTTHAREMTFEENEDVVKGVQFVATLDSRTTEICMSLDGQVFDVGDGPRPPMHYQCRSTTVPVLKSLEELGLPKLREALPEGTRATKEVRGYLQKVMNGQVPDRVTYGPWLRKQSKTVQNEALGPGRAKLFRAGKVSIDKFVDTRGRPLTLDQLREKEGLKPSEKKRRVPSPPVPPSIPQKQEHWESGGIEYTIEDSTKHGPPRKFKSTLKDEYDKEFERHSGIWARKLTVAEVDAVSDYTDVGFTGINDNLRGSKPVFTKEIKAIDSAIAKGSFPRNGTVERIVIAEEGFNPSNLLGKTIRDKAFTSTSALPIPDETIRIMKKNWWTENPTPVVFRIKVAKGMPTGTLGTGIGVDYEREIILPRGAGIRIDSVRKEATKFVIEGEYVK